MMNFFTDFAKECANNLPLPLQGLKNDFELQMRLGLEAMLEKMQLVKREEFEAQKQVLERTQATVARLEDRLSRLEDHFTAKN